MATITPPDQSDPTAPPLPEFTYNSKFLNGYEDLNGHSNHFYKEKKIRRRSERGCNAEPSEGCKALYFHPGCIDITAKTAHKAAIYAISKGKGPTVIGEYNQNGDDKIRYETITGEEKKMLEDKGWIKPDHQWEDNIWTERERYHRPTSVKPSFV